MRLIDIARSYLAAPEGAGAGASGGGTQPAAGAGGGGAAAGTPEPKGGASSALGGTAAKGGEGSAAADGAGKGDGKPGAGTDGASDQGKPKEGDAPAEFKVTVPDGVKVDDAQLKSFTDWAQKSGLTSDQATKAIAFYADLQKQGDAAWQKQGEEWGKQLQTDKVVGGKDYSANVVAAQKAVQRFGGAELAADLERLGVGNLPSLVRAFVKIGKALSEDTAAVETAPKGGEQKLDAKGRLAKRYDHPDSRAAGTK